MKPVNLHFLKNGGAVADKKNLTIQIKDEEHRKLKSLAATKGLTIKEAVLSALDAMFPGWREENKK